MAGGNLDVLQFGRIGQSEVEVTRRFIAAPAEDRTNPTIGNAPTATAAHRGTAGVRQSAMVNNAWPKRAVVPTTRHAKPAHVVSLVVIVVLFP